MQLQLQLRQELRQELRLDGPHSPIRNPTLTREASGRGLEGSVEGTLAEVLSIRSNDRLTQYGKMLAVEGVLLDMWAYRDAWENYLDSSLTAHTDAALVLKEEGYDGVVGIRSAGIPYQSIFGMIGLEEFSVDFSHYKRGMDTPAINTEAIAMLREKKKVLLTDIDFVTGRTLKTVANFLWDEGVEVYGAYIGLHAWPGIEGDGFRINSETTNFNRFWKLRRNGLMEMRDKRPYVKGLLPAYLKVYGAYPQGDRDKCIGTEAARRVARALLQQLTVSEE